MATAVEEEAAEDAPEAEEEADADAEADAEADAAAAAAAAAEEEEVIEATKSGTIYVQHRRPMNVFGRGHL